MIYELNLNGSGGSVFGAAGLEDIRNCLCMIAAVRTGTVPLYRHFGTNWSWIDAPEPTAMARYRADLMEAIKRFEPRVDVVSISFKRDAAAAGTGRIFPVVKFKLKEGVTL